MIRLLFTRRWLGYLALTVVFAIVASLFGMWQWDRRTQAVAAMEILDSHWDTAPEPLWEVVGSGFADTQEWIPVVVTGEYIAKDQFLVRTRPRGGQVGFEVLVPLLTQDGRYVIVNRGWVPTGEAQDFPDVLPEPPESTVNVVARLKPPEPTLRGRGAPAGQLASIDLGAVDRALSYEISTDFYLLLASETPSVSPAPLVATKPLLDEGPHLSYTFQWYIFGLLAFTGLVVLLRQEAQRAAGVEPKRRSSLSDADEEDALLEGERTPMESSREGN
jgi:cytochrome oxidase assembly protein ShyY1